MAGHQGKTDRRPRLHVDGVYRLHIERGRLDRSSLAQWVHRSGIQHRGVGFLLMMAYILLIPWRLYQALRRAPSSSAIHRVSAGCMALYVFLIINGLFNSSFGGKPTSPFMLLLALLVVSNKLARLASEEPANGAGKSLRWQPV